METIFNFASDLSHDSQVSFAPFPRSLDDRDRRSLRSSLACWSKLDGRRRVVLDETRAIVACDPDFISFVARSPEFRIQNGRFGPTDHRLASALTWLSVEASETGTTLVPKSSGGHWICCAARLSEYGGCALIGIAIRAGGEDSAPTWPDFRPAFHLTNTENSVLTKLLSGFSPQAIAELHALSVNTVRTHIRHLYEKLEVKSQPELWRKLCSYRLR